MTLSIAAERRKYELAAKAKFIKQLDKALGLCYQAGMENNGAVLSLNIKELYQYLTNEKRTS